MEPRFTRGEYWLLEIVVEREFPVYGLIDSELEWNLNKKGHGLTRAALVETLHRLLSAGLIYAKNEGDGFISTYEQIERALAEPKPKLTDLTGKKKSTYYGLTQEGGAQWEVFAAPNWQHFIDENYLSSDEYEDGICELMCGNKKLLERYIESICYHDRHREFILETVRWDYIAPWQATYWKQLDGAHRVRFQDRVKTEPNVRPPPSPWPPFVYRVWYAWG